MLHAGWGGAVRTPQGRSRTRGARIAAPWGTRRYARNIPHAVPVKWVRHGDQRVQDLGRLRRGASALHAQQVAAAAAGSAAGHVYVQVHCKSLVFPFYHTKSHSGVLKIGSFVNI